MEVPSQNAQSDDMKKVSFSFPTPETDLSETAKLLDTFSRLPPTTAMVAPAPQVATTAPSAPHNMDAIPNSVDEWPKNPQRLPCTHCGHYIETSTNEETEYMGCKACFTGNPVFRRSYVHYCPNCGESIGFHYTGEDCFCNHQRSTMTCDRVIAASCSWQGCCTE
ncbi:hypothetical protein CEUSTIGMA_g6011.t1 [Chlamydomonas eustigma]|uniref:LITAF domain-containing protein n=1 Tax=Chlamydomonas eustigma TaxID=1157962 RepID=A0A250X667_9CHLO|nr:hypothetical protein CEUSTIGMA_g6011.t1 [Chlamydomonas eustigma]|eukprot:GAX78571.1 hypothetical protein CEUSTIGMA_g6011.t1 [Chlamydomonas eustigma]